MKMRKEEAEGRKESVSPPSSRTGGPDMRDYDDGSLDEHEMCPRCGCCEIVWEECDNCGGEGVSGHDCGEDVCCCADPEDNVPCDYCGGQGGGYVCLGHCDEHGKHVPEDRT